MESDRLLAGTGPDATGRFNGGVATRYDLIRGAGLCGYRTRDDRSTMKRDVARCGKLRGSMMCLFTTAPGVPAVMTPLATDLAPAVGWSILAVLMTQVIGFSTIIFPYQAPALVIAMDRGDIPLKTGLRLVFVLAVLTLVVLTPLNYLWWHLLGYFVPSA